MIPIYSHDPVVFTPHDRERVVKACQDLYGLTRSNPESDNRLGRRVRRWAFSKLGGSRDDRTDVQEVLASGRALRVLVFRYDAIGDYIVTSPFMRWLITNVPGVEIDVVGSTRNVGMLRRDPFVSHVTAIHPGHPPHPSWLRVRDHVANRPPDVVAGLVFTRMTKAAILTSFAGLRPLRVTIAHDSRRSIYGQVFDVQVDHLVAKEHWMETMAKVGPAVFDRQVQQPSPYIVLEAKAVQTVVRRLSEFDTGYQLVPQPGLVWAKDSEPVYPSTSGRKYVVFNVSAFSPNRVWSIQRAVSTAVAVCSGRSDVMCFVTGGPDARTRLDIATGLRMHPQVKAWQGSLSELTALIAGAAVVVTPDTAALHMAATSARPVVALFAELIKVAEWFPFNTNYRALLSPNPDSIDAIPEELIATHVLELLSC